MPDTTADPVAAALEEIEAVEGAAFPPPDETILAAGLRWLYETVQPDGAIIDNHGVCHGNGDRTRLYHFISNGFNGLPVVVVDVVGWKYDPGADEIDQLLSSDEMAAIGEAITRLGGTILSTWNGDGCVTGSFGLSSAAHPTLSAAVTRCRARCPDHPHAVSCSPCTWYRDGYAQIVQPEWDSADEALTGKKVTGGRS